MGRTVDIRLAVIGAGSWGTTVAALACVNTPTVLWARRPELAEQITSAHVNADYLPAFFPLPHPSPRNRFWLRRHPWFDAEVLPLLRQQVALALSG